MYLIPAPRYMKKTDGDVVLDYRTRIVLDVKTGVVAFEAAKALATGISEETGISFALSKAFEPGKNEKNKTVRLEVSEKVFDDLVKENEEEGKNAYREGYVLLVNENGVSVTAATDAGLLYGTKTLLQIIRQCGLVLPQCEIRDYPMLPNRGFYHDATRGRVQTLDSYKRLADLISDFKYNQLQLNIEHTFMFRNFSEIWRDDDPMTAEEILELDAYCKKLNIDLVPSLATFGHLYKVLRSKTYEHLCELDCPGETDFSFVDRMQHHTLNVSDERSIKLVEEMLDEFMPLFSSNYFNICADETFDLGKGKSRAYAEEKGTDSIYIEFVNKICKIVASHGKTPMFWGDIIKGFPEKKSELPDNIICLNWGYCDNEWEGGISVLHDNGLRQYICPGVHGWLHSINKIHMAYRNIALMTGYALKYNALGLLNTDWGDYGHFQDPCFSLPGMVYGGAFAWSGITDEDEINEEISKLIYGDCTGKLLDVMRNMSECEHASWERFVQYMDLKKKGMDDEELLRRLPRELTENPQKVNECILENEKKLYSYVNSVNKNGKMLIRRLLVHGRAQRLINSLMYFCGTNGTKEEAFNLATETEKFVNDYKKVWRETSKESERFRIEETFFWFADYVRDLPKK